MLFRLRPGPISPVVRGVAGGSGGALVAAGLFMLGSVLLPLLTSQAAPSPWTSFTLIVGGLGCIGVARKFIRAAITGVSPNYQRTLPKP